MTRARDLSRAVNNKMSVFKYTATAGQTTFTGADGGGATLAYDPNSMIVTYNGIILESTTEYTATNGTSVVLTAGAEVGAEVNILAFEDVAYSGVMPTTGGTFTGNVTVSGTLGAGETTITGPLNVSSANGQILNVGSSSSGGTDLSVYVDGNEVSFRVDPDNNEASSVMTFDLDGSEKMRVTNDGKVGIGINTPTAPLHIESPDNSDFMHITVTGNEKWALRGESGSGSNDFLGLGIAGGVQAMYWNEAGEVQAPSQPSFYAYPSSNVTLTLAGAWTTVNFGSTGWNTGNHYNTSNSRFTAPVAGRYLITWMWQLENNNVVDWMYFYPRLNSQNSQNKPKGFSFADFRNEAGYHTESGSWIVNLAANDYVDIVCRGVGGDKSFKDESHWTMILLS